jgi:hypothetical protein
MGMRGVIWCGQVGLAALLLATAGCSLLRSPAKGTQTLVHAVEGTIGMAQPTNMIPVVQTDVMREADNYVTIVAQAANEFAAKVGTPEARTAALEWKLHQGDSAFNIAVGENPLVNAVDFVVLASLSRGVVEDYWVPKFGPAALPLLEVHRRLETNAWSVVAEVLSFQQRVDLRDLIKAWLKDHPHQRYVSAIRLRDIMAVLGKQAVAGAATKPSSVLNLLSIDPFAGLEPAVRQFTEARFLAERLMFYLERMPMLLSWQVEELTYGVAAQPTPQQVVSNLTSFAESAQVFANTAQHLPELVNHQRQAAINQVFAGVTVQRSNILASLNAQEGQLRELLPEVRRTLEAGTEMGNSLKGSINSLDQFVRYVSPPHTNEAPASTNHHPFNVAEYGTAATQIAAMSRDLDRLLLTVDRSSTQLTLLGEQVGGRVDRAVNRAFLLGFVLIAILLAGAVLAGLAYRVLAARLNRRLEPPAG